jgi:hypothetical protein
MLWAVPLGTATVAAEPDRSIEHGITGVQFVGERERMCVALTIKVAAELGSLEVSEA